MVSVLCSSQMIHWTIGNFLHNIPYLTADPSSRFVFVPFQCPGTKPQEFARNTIIEHFLKTDCDTLVMVDHDMIIHDPTILGLLDTPEYDIAGPLQLMYMQSMKDGPSIQPCAFMYDDKEPRGKRLHVVTPVSGEPVTRVDAVGSGVIAIKRRVLEDPKMLNAEGMSPPAFFRNRYAENGERWRGLDIDFCVRARDLGYRIKVNWQATCGHLKTEDLYGLEIYAKNQFVMGLERGKQNVDGLHLEEGQSGPQGRDDGRAGLRAVGDSEVG